jgi:hypothetical protein
LLGRCREDNTVMSINTKLSESDSSQMESRPQSPAQTPASSSKYHHPYFTPAEVEYLSDKQRGKLSVTGEEKVRQNACGFLEAIGARIGLYVHRFNMLYMTFQRLSVLGGRPQLHRTCISVFIFSFLAKTSIIMCVNSAVLGCRCRWC